jgi:hypothetical protein
MPHRQILRRTLVTTAVAQEAEDAQCRRHAGDAEGGEDTLQKAMPGLEISRQIDPEIEHAVKNWRTRNP